MKYTVLFLFLLLNSCATLIQSEYNVETSFTVSKRAAFDKVLRKFAMSGYKVGLSDFNAGIIRFEPKNKSVTNVSPKGTIKRTTNYVQSLQLVFSDNSVSSNNEYQCERPVGFGYAMTLDFVKCSSGSKADVENMNTMTDETVALIKSSLE